MFNLKIIKSLLIIVIILEMHITAYFAWKILKDIDLISDNFDRTTYQNYE